VHGLRPERLDLAVAVHDGGGAGGPAGTIWLDQFTTSNENVSDTIARTVRDGTDERYGVNFEQGIPDLISRFQKEALL